MNFDVVIDQLFPNDQFEVAIKRMSTTTSSSTITVIVRSRAAPTTGICLQLIITPLESIVVSTLTKCNDVTRNEGSGSALMLKVKQLAKTLKIDTIQLYDDSKVRVCGDTKDAPEIDLFRLKILTKGKSWYNSLGYKSEYYAEEIEHNREVILSSILQVASQLKLELDTGRFPPTSPDETVQAYITRLLQHLPCDHETGAYLKYVIDNVSKLLWYERMLEKKIRITSKSKSRIKRKSKRNSNSNTSNSNTSNSNSNSSNSNGKKGGGIRIRRKIKTRRIEPVITHSHYSHHH